MPNLMKPVLDKTRDPQPPANAGGGDDADVTLLIRRCQALALELDDLRERYRFLTVLVRGFRDLQSENKALRNRRAPAQALRSAWAAFAALRTMPWLNMAPRLRWLMMGAAAWLSFRPDTRPRRAASTLIKAGGRAAKRLRQSGLPAVRPKPPPTLSGSHETRSSNPEILGCDPIQNPVYFWVHSTVRFAGNTGIQRVARQLARSLMEAGHTMIPVRWDGPQAPLGEPSLKELEHFARWNGPAVDQWAPWTTPGQHRGDGWFMMAEVPTGFPLVEQQKIRLAAQRANLKTAAIFYDVIPWKMRDIYTEEAGISHLEYMKEISNYDKIISISKYSESELIKVLNCDLERPAARLPYMVACPLPAEFPERSERAPAQGSHRYREVHILCVGTIEPRKNHELLLDAFDLACLNSSVPLHLTIAGGLLGFDAGLILRVRDRLAGAPNITWVQKADDSKIRDLYEACDFTIYPSVEEGFGMPILESLWYGKPVICAAFGAMLEAAEGGGALPVDVTDAAAMAVAMVRLAEHPAERERLSRCAQARTFRSWRAYAADVAQILQLPDVAADRLRQT